MMVMTEVDIRVEGGSAVELEMEVSVEKPGGAPPLEALIAFILDRFHEAHRREFPALISLAKNVESVHAKHAACPVGLAHVLAEMHAELEAHMAKEEQMLFPALLSGGAGCTPFAIRRMWLEHVDHDARLQQLRVSAHAFRPPPDASPSWRKLYAGCEKLHDDLRAHIDTENDILFPMFE